MKPKQGAVPERVVERLWLGELSDAEAQRVLERLEQEEGGPARLEALIADDERFLDEHPPRRAVAAIRTRYAASQRAAAQRSSPWRGRIALAVTVVAAAAAVAVAVALRARAPAEVGAEPTLGAEAPALGAPSVLRWDGRNARGLAFGATEAEGAAQVVLELGQIVTLKTTGVDRVVVENDSVVVATGSRERNYLEARSLGQSSVRFFGRGRLVAHAALRVMAPHDRDAVEKVAAASGGVVAGCFDGAGAQADAALRVRFATDGGGRVTHAQPEWSTVGSELERCVLDAVRGWQLPVEAGARTAALRFAARERMVCAPGEEC